MRLMLGFVLAALFVFPAIQALRSGRIKIAGSSISKVKNPLVFWSSVGICAGIALAVIILEFLKNA
jgi:hypothetical protein